MSRSIKGLFICFLILLIQASGFAQRGPSYLRKRTLGGSLQDYSTTYFSTADSGLMVFGAVSSNDKHALNSGYHTNSWRPPDIWVLKLNKSWNIEWQKAYGGSSNDIATAVAPGHGGGFIMAGFTDSRDGDVTGVHGSSTDRDAWVVKISPTGAIEWAKCYGGTSRDDAYDVIQTYDGGYLLANWTASANGDVSSNHGAFDLWLVKINSTGTILWEKSYGGTGTDAPSRVLQTQDSGFVVFGSTTSTDGDVTSNHGSFDVWVLKVDKTGTIQWQRSLGGPGTDFPTHVVRTRDGGFAFTGGTNSIGGDVAYWRGGLGHDLWVVKLSDTCTIEWEKTYGGTNDEAGYYLLEEPDSSFLVSGQTQSLDGTVDFFHHGSFDAWLLKLTKTGGLTWQQTYGGSNQDWSGKVSITKDGYMFLGTTYSKDKDVLGLSLDSISLHAGDLWLAELCQTTGYTLSPEIPNMGSVPLCTFRDTLIEIRDTGCYSLFIDSVKVTGADFALLKRPKNKILWDAVDTFVVRYQPLRRGPSTGAVTVYYNERYSQKTLTIPLTGTGGPGAVQLTSSLDSFAYRFPPISVCSRKDTQYVTIKNLGCDTIRIIDITFQDDGTTLQGSRVGKLPAKLIGTDSLWCRWIISPSTPGTFQAKIILRLEFPDGTTRDTILTADATILPGSAKLSNSLNTSAYVFKSRPACTNVDSVRFAIRNLGCDTLEIIGVTFADDGTTLRGVGPASGSLIGNQELTYRWMLDPKKPGTYQAGITITFKLPDGSTHDTTFQASITILPGAPVFHSSLPAATYSFASRSLCADNDTAAIVIRNGGCDTLDILNVTFNNAAELTGSIGMWDSTLAESDSLTITWIFDPATQGSSSASVTITYRSLDGSEHDTTLNINATILPGDALFVSSLADPAYLFSARPACGQTDSVRFSIMNPGCDTLSILNISYTNSTGLLEGSLVGSALPTLIAGDSMIFQWLAAAVTPGTYQALINVTYKLPDGSQHDTTFTASVTITSGSKTLVRSIPSVAYGKTYLCEERDTLLIFTNKGCDTLSVFDIIVSGTGFTVIQPTAFPIVLQPDEQLSITIRTIPGDTTGRPPAFAHMLEVLSTADNGQLQTLLTRQVVYPAQCTVDLSSAQTAGNLKRTSYAVSIIGEIPQEATAISFDVSYNRDLLELLSTVDLPGITVTPAGTAIQGDLAITTFSASPVRTGDIVTLEFLAYLAKADTTLVSISNVRFNVPATVAQECIAKVSEGMSVFRYDDNCGEPTIRQRLLGNTAFEIIGIRPQPAEAGSPAYVDLIVYEPGNVTITARTISGVSTGIVFSGQLENGLHSIPLLLTGEGVHFLTVETAGRSGVRKVVTR